MSEPIRFSRAELEAELEATRARGKPFAREWLDLAALPPLVRAGSVQRGSYVHDDPVDDDPRTVPFAEVPPIVWSEGLGDLHTILGDPRPTS